MKHYKINTALKIMLLCLLPFIGALGQTKPNYYDSARVYYFKKDFKQAIHFYDTYYADTAHGPSNYDTYYAAVAACHVGLTEKASYYLKLSGEIGYDWSAYDTFANDPLNTCLRDLPGWKKFIGDFKHQTDSANIVIGNYLQKINDTTERINYSQISDSLKINLLLKHKTADEVVRWIKNYKNFAAPPVKAHGTMYHMKVNDTLTVPFFVYIPKSYNPAKKTKLYIFLHGAVSMRPAFFKTPMLYSNDNVILKEPIENNAIIIYPLARKGFNWLYNINAFETIIKEISFIKALYNIDDNKVYIAGHSDGGTGTFWLATHMSYPFASFLGLNHNAQSYFDNTNLFNLVNQTIFYGISGTDDETFNIKSITNIKNYGLSIGANWHGFNIKGDHGIPYNKSNTISFIYDSLFSQIRNPLPKKIQWETDNIKTGRNYWLAITKLDTLAEKAVWQKTYSAPPVTIDQKIIKYNFNPHRSGAFTADIKNNVVNIKASRVKELVFYASTELVDLNKPVKIYVNEKLVFNALIKKDKAVILDEFIKTRDRSLIIVNKISISL